MVVAGLSLVVTAVLFFGFLVLVLVLLAALGPKRDVLDWDPTDRVAARLDAEDQDLEQMLERHNERRRAKGLPEEDEVDLRRRMGR